MDVNVPGSEEDRYSVLQPEVRVALDLLTADREQQFKGLVAVLWLLVELDRQRDGWRRLGSGLRTTVGNRRRHDSTPDIRSISETAAQSSRTVSSALVTSGEASTAGRTSAL